MPVFGRTGRLSPRGDRSTLVRSGWLTTFNRVGAVHEVSAAESRSSPARVWRHKWLGVATAWLVCTAGWIGVALVPTRYESSARVYLNSDPPLTPLVRGVAAGP